MKMEMNEDDLEEIAYDESEDEDELALEDGEKTKPWVMLATFGGLVVVAAIICAVLWRFTHSGNHNDTPTGSNLPTESVTDTLALEPSEGMSEAAMEASGEPAQGQEPTSIGTEPISPENPDGQEQGTEQETTGGSTSGQDGAASPSQPAESENPVDEPVSGTTSMEFTEVNDEVTAKDVTNLRSAPSTVDADNVVAQLKNGDKLSRTGTNSSTGWSRLAYNGEVVYAVTQFLTTDLNYKAPVAAADPNRITTLDGRVIIFADCSDNITPKEYVNLRTEPSTSQGETTVRCQVKNGETVLRTGYSTDSGWSRVEYNGEVLYVVSSLMKAAE